MDVWRRWVAAGSALAVVPGFGVAAAQIPQAQAADSVCVPGSTVLTPTVLINAGGPDFTADGQTWSGDKFFKGGTTYTTPSQADIAGTTLDGLYRSQREGVRFSYEIPVSSGTYLVRLHFAEVYWKAPLGSTAQPGRREQSVTVENRVVLRRYDPARDAAGSMRSVVRGVETAVSDGALSVGFKASVNQAAVQAIEVLRSSTCPSPTATPTTTTPTTTTTTPAVPPGPLKLDPRPVVLNALRSESGRGMFDWLNQPSILDGYTPRDVYWRDQLQWAKQLERTPGQYDLSSVEAGLAKAASQGGKFSFRIMPTCPGCGENLTPSWVPRQANGAPDWNSEGYLSSYENLMRAIGARYDSDPRLGTVDLSGYGMWGEWYCDDTYCGTPITQANTIRLARAVTAAFPSHYVLNGLASQYTNTVLSLNSRIGLRFDCVGGMDIGIESFPETNRQVWRRAPVLGEWCPGANSTPAKGLENVRSIHISGLSSANYPRTGAQLSAQERAELEQVYDATGHQYQVTGAQFAAAPVRGQAFSFTSTWKNVGVAPTYDRWVPQLRLLDSSGREVYAVDIALDLLSVLDTQPTVITTGTLPAGLSGQFTVALRVRDPQGYLPPLNLSNSGRDTNGNYPLGTITLG